MQVLYTIQMAENMHVMYKNVSPQLQVKRMTECAMPTLATRIIQPVHTSHFQHQLATVHRVNVCVINVNIYSTKK
jgi:hypothetical protein